MSLCVASIPDSILGLVSFCWSFAAQRVEDVCKWTVRLSRCFAPKAPGGQRRLQLKNKERTHCTMTSQR